jgi:hypothetical protein
MCGRRLLETRTEARMLCLILLILFFSRRHYWGYGYPYYSPYNPYRYGYAYGSYPYGAYSYYNPNVPYGGVYQGRYGYCRPYGYW